MRQAQHRFEHAQQRSTRCALLRFVTDLHLNFREFQIPIAIFVPSKFVHRARDQIEAQRGELIVRFLFRTLQTAGDPTIGLGEL